MSQTLINEFFRYTCIKKIIDFNHNYEYLNIIERWMLTAANDYQEGDMDRIIDPRKLKKSYFATEKMIEELQEKKLDPGIANHVLSIMKIWTKTENHIKSLSVKLDKNILCIKHNPSEIFLYPFPEDLLEVLLTRGTLDQLGCVCLRYACILQQTQQWANPDEFYSMLVGDFGASIEGFASPLNSRIIGVKSQVDTKFCSLFPDVDAPFGSIGSFFDQDFSGKVVTICPPYTNFIFDAILDRVKWHQQNNSQFMFIFGLADWTNVPLLDFLEENAQYKHTTKKNNYSFIDVKSDVIVPAVFGNRYYVLSTYDFDPKPFIDYFEYNKMLTKYIINLESKFKDLNSTKLVNDRERKQFANWLIMKKKVTPLYCLVKRWPNFKIILIYLLAELFKNKKNHNIADTKKYINYRINQCST